MEEAQKFGSRLRELRIQAGMSQRELADRVNVDFTYLSKIEKGATPPPSSKVILRLAENLDTDQDELLILADKIPPDIAELLKDLYEKGIGSVMVEGGGFTLDSFIDSGLWNEARVFEASKTFDKGINAPNIDSAPSKVEMIGKDKLLYFRNEVK